jgi:hypothetical protein
MGKKKSNLNYVHIGVWALTNQPIDWQLLEPYLPNLPNPPNIV